MTDLPPANAELRRLFAAGPPSDGNEVPLYRALLGAQLVVLQHGQGGPLVMARPARSGRGEEAATFAFTHHELADRFAAGVRDAGTLGKLVMGTKALCKKAIALNLAAVDIDRGGAGYAIRYAGMVNVLSSSAPSGPGKVTLLESVRSVFAVPKERPPAAMLAELRVLAVQHGVQQLSWCYRWLGEAPGEMQLVYAPFPSRAFEKAVQDRLIVATGGKFTMGTHDALAATVDPELRQRLL